MIGISKCDKNFNFYEMWLSHNNEPYLILDYAVENDKNKLNNCSGLILTGGVDIYPELYNDWETKEDAGKYNPQRDGFEFKLIETAINNKIPILGICRGCQLLNVYFKGSLIYDIESIRNVVHTKYNDEKYREHQINIHQETLLYKLLGTQKTTVNSSHHQSVDRVGEGLSINTRAEDGIIEGIEFTVQSRKILGVQWHPEMLDYDDVASSGLLKLFE